MAKSIAAEYPENALIHILLGSAYFNTGQTDMAATHLRKCLALDNNILEAHEILTRIAYEKGNPEEAVRLCVEARNRGLSSPKLLNRLARAQMDLGQAEKSIQTLLEAIKVSHPLAESFYLLGQARMQARDYLEAKESFIQTTEEPYIAKLHLLNFRFITLILLKPTHFYTYFRTVRLKFKF